MLTYAATLNASAVVWIAERFTDEHRRAFEWLNDHTSEDLSLYAVELVLWQIDQSKPAVQFNVLTQESLFLVMKPSERPAYFACPVDRR